LAAALHRAGFGQVSAIRSLISSRLEIDPDPQSGFTDEFDRQRIGSCPSRAISELAQKRCSMGGVA
jgi:hypothetical protein